jgi:hypothetical protein
VGLLTGPIINDIRSARAAIHDVPEPGMAAAVAFLRDHAKPADVIIVSNEINWTYTYYAYRANLTHEGVFLPEATHVRSASIPAQSQDQHHIWILLSTFRADSPNSELNLILPRAREIGRENQRYPFAGICIVDFSVPLMR